MRVAIVSDNFYPEIGGIQDSIVGLALGLKSQGHEVDFYAPRASTHDFEIVKLPVRELDLGPHVRVHRFASIPIPSPTLQSRLVIPTFTRWRTIQKSRPDVIHSHGFFGLGLEAIRAAKMLKVPLVGTNHWAFSEFAKYVPIVPRVWFERYSLKYVSWYFNHCDFVSAPSRSVLTEMQAFGFHRLCQVVSNPIDTSIFRPTSLTARKRLKKEFGLPGMTMVYAGRLAPEKKIDVLIRALPLIQKSVPKISLALAGHGSERDELERLAKELNVSDAVKFVGTLDKPRLAQLFQASDVVTITSTSETQSMVILQAMAAGLPAIAVRWRALTELVKPENGFLIDANNHIQLAEKVMLLAKKPALGLELGAAAAAAMHKFSATEVEKTWEKIYASIIKDYRTRRL